MRKLTGAAFVSLDGVIQAPGGPSEDPTGGFRHGGWLAGYFDEAIGDQIDQLFGGRFDLLMGRRTYDIFAAYWPFVDGDAEDIGPKFGAAAKYVLTGGDQPLEWANSHRLANLDAVAAVKAGDGPDLIIQGSSTLYPQLLAAGLLDRLILMTFPVVLGTGKRLFGEGTPPLSLRAADQRITPSGAVISVYEPAGAVETGSFDVTDGPSPAELVRRARMADGTW